MKGIPIPISFAVMLAAIVALVIFFGAWAVSADAAQRERSLSFIVASSSNNLGVSPVNPSLPPYPRTAAQGDEVGSKADAWWGKALLTACPLH
jgi:hypothetical protein